MNSIITLTTDFGEGSYYIGSMKGVILGIVPDARIVDVTHSISQGDVLSAAFVVFSAYSYFPPGTVHVIVVDPGVGSARPIIAAKIDGHLFLAPDNGVLGLILQKKRADAIRKVINRRYFPGKISSTFHGRDIFAPAASHLARGLAVSKLGPAFSSPVMLNISGPKFVKNRIEGTIIYVDSFGNCISNISRDLLDKGVDPSAVTVGVKNRKIRGLFDFYAEKKKGTLMALFGSSGFLEIAVTGASAAAKLNIKPPCPVTVAIR